MSKGEPRHIPALDGLRAIALLLVMFHHWTQLNAPPHWSDHSALGKVIFYIGDGTWCGVDLFFVLSGFLITGILLDTREQPRFFSNFYLRRTLRIFPPYYLFLFLAFVVLRPLFASNSTWQQLSHQQLWYWLYIENWHTAFFGWAPYAVLHFWSLAVEEQFYLFWPLLVFFSGPRRTIIISLLLILLMPCLRAGLIYHSSLQDPAAFNYVSTITRLGPLAWGAVLAALQRLPDGAARIRKLAPLLAVPGLMVMFVLLVIHRQTSKVDPLMQIYGYSALALLFAGTLAWTISNGERDPLVRLGSQPLLRQIGKVSYVAYIVHAPIFVFAAAAFPAHPALTLLGCTAATFALAFASWRFLETPLLKLKNRIAPSLNAKSAA